MPTFNFSDTTPVAANPPSTSPNDFVRNFTSIDGLLSVDHVSFNAANGGCHNQSTYLAQSSNPTTSSGQITHFAKTTAGKTEEYVIRDGSATPIQMTTGNVTVAASGTTFLPGGILLQWGPCNANGTGVSNSFATAFPNHCYSVVVVGTNFSQPTNVIKVTSVSVSAFTAKSTLGESGYYIAIGN